MLAYWIALRIGLTRPYWAVTTSYIVAQPLAGAVLSKAVFRLIGTVLGLTYMKMPSASKSHASGKCQERPLSMRSNGTARRDRMK